MRKKEANFFEQAILIKSFSVFLFNPTGLRDFPYQTFELFLSISVRARKLKTSRIIQFFSSFPLDLGGFLIYLFHDFGFINSC